MFILEVSVSETTMTTFPFGCCYPKVIEPTFNDFVKTSFYFQKLVQIGQKSPIVFLSSAIVLCS